MTGPARRRLGRCGPSATETLLLQAALLDHDAAVAAWHSWRAQVSLEDASWREQMILPVVAHHLGDEIGEHEARLASARRRVTWIDNQRDLEGLRNALQTAGAPECLLIKGAALVDRVYPPGLRVMGDADIVVGHDEYAATVERLVAAGWEPYDRIADIDVSRAVGLTGPDGRSIDVHRRVIFPRYTRGDDDGMWRRAVVDERFTSVKVLDPADAIVVAVLNGLDPEAAIRWPIDVHLLAANDPDGDLWDRVAASAREVGVERRVGLGLDWCRAELGLAVDEALCSELRSAPLSGMLRAEWEINRLGLSVQARIRQYRDTERALGRTPNMFRYGQLRWSMFQESGGARQYLMRRPRRALATARRLFDR